MLKGLTLNKMYTLFLYIEKKKNEESLAFILIYYFYKILDKS